MASLAWRSLREKKYPFIFALSILLLLLVLHLTTTNTNVMIRFSSFSSDHITTSTTVSPHASTPTSSPPPFSTPLSVTKPILRSPAVNSDRSDSDADGGEEEKVEVPKLEICKVRNGIKAVDYIPCLDNVKAIKELKSRGHMEHRERHCPEQIPRCLVALPDGYKVPVRWPKSRDKIWFNNVPHLKLVEYKKDQNWVQVSGEYLMFPGGGTQFKEGVLNYIEFVEKTLPTIEWGGRTRVILDVGCGVASFGGYLLDKDVITMSVAPKDEHEAQIQFALERGIPAVLAVIGTQRLPFSDNSYDAIHCARCRVHWDADGGKPLLELNRILRPGGFFIWSATPVYRDSARDQGVWNAMVALTDSICWRTVVKATESNGIGLVIYQKPFSNSCYNERKENIPPLCDASYWTNFSWYIPLDGCLPKLPVYSTVEEDSWPSNWPERLVSGPLSLSGKSKSQGSVDILEEDTQHWNMLVSNTYLQNLGIKWTAIRNVMDMNAVYGGFAAALTEKPLWVMNVVPVHGQDTLTTIFDRGLIGIYHDWCEAFNTYPRTYDLLHASYLLGNLTNRCDIVDVVVEMDRILRPGGWVVVQDSLETIRKVRSFLNSLHWKTRVHDQKLLVGVKSFWRPAN